MQIEKIPMRVVKLIAHCPKCNGTMRTSGKSIMLFPMQFPHKCEQCGYEENYDSVYPAIGHEEGEE